MSSEDSDYSPEIKDNSAKKKKMPKSTSRNEYLSTSRNRNLKFSTRTTKNTRSSKPKVPAFNETKKGIKNIPEIKRNKNSIIAKAKNAWENYKKIEGLEDELKHSSDQGYIEKKIFLERSKYKEWEDEIRIQESGNN